MKLYRIGTSAPHFTARVSDVFGIQSGLLDGESTPGASKSSKIALTILLTDAEIGTTSVQGSRLWAQNDAAAYSS